MFDVIGKQVTLEQYHELVARVCTRHSHPRLNVAAALARDQPLRSGPA